MHHRNWLLYGGPYSINDMRMPDMDSEELGRRIKSDPQLHSTVLVMLTSLGSRGDAKRLEAAGFAAYLSKPIRRTHLYDCLALALGAEPEDRSEPRPQPLITRHSLSEDKKRRLRILLAEDNATNQTVTLAILDKLGYRADVVANGEQALEALRASAYDLVLMDCHMPVMDGYTATRRIRDEAGVKNPGVPVIAMTANAMQGDREKCLASGMNDYLSKPVDPWHLAVTVEHWLGAKMARGTVPSAPTHSETPAAPAGTGDPMPALFDRDGLKTRLMGDEALIETVVNGFMEDMPRQLGLLEAFIDKAQTPQTCEQAHKIKGAMGNIGSPALWQMAAEMERAGRSGDLDRLKALMPQLRERFGRLIETIKAQGLR